MAKMTRYVYYKTITSPDGSKITLECLKKLRIWRGRGQQYQAVYLNFDEQSGRRKSTVKLFHNPKQAGQFIAVPVWDEVHLNSRLKVAGIELFHGVKYHFDNTEDNEGRRVHMKDVVGLDPDQVEVIEKKKGNRGRGVEFQGTRRYYHNQGDEDPDPVTGDKPEVNIVHMPEFDIG